MNPIRNTYFVFFYFICYARDISIAISDNRAKLNF